MSLRAIVFLIWGAAIASLSKAADTVKAGDPAPQIVWTQVLRPESAAGPPVNLAGSITVVYFFPNLAGNEPMLTEWNALVAEFEGQPVNFLWITPEEESSLGPVLRKDGVRGWLLRDARTETEKAYGAEMMSAAIVEAHGKIAGFTRMLPLAEQIRAVQQGTSIAIQGNASDEQLNALLANKAVRVEAEPDRMPGPTKKPDLPPSYEVHIMPSKTDGTESTEGTDFLVRKSFDLRAIVVEVYGVEAGRVVLPASLDKTGDRYDFVLVLPGPAEQSEMHKLIQEGIERKFGLTKRLEQRATDVYVMTAIPGKVRPAKTDAQGFSGGAYVNSDFVVTSGHAGEQPTAEELRKEVEELMDVAMLSSITTMNSSMPMIRMALEQGLHRPIVDETGLTGEYDLELKGQAKTKEEFIQMLRDQAGIVLTPGHRPIEMTVFLKRP
jgi:uncharacterized protein (TIGR03435 family)